MKNYYGSRTVYESLAKMTSDDSIKRKVFIKQSCRAIPPHASPPIRMTGDERGLDGKRATTHSDERVDRAAMRRALPYGALRKAVLLFSALTTAVACSSLLFDRTRVTKGGRLLVDTFFARRDVEENLKPCREMTDQSDSIQKIVVDKCVRSKDIDDVVAVVAVMNAHGVRVFPRNGFLLGVTRHGGYLPNESVDADLGVIYGDVLRKPRVFDVKDERHTYKVTRRPRGRWATFDGLDPWTKQEYAAESIVISRDDRVSFSAFCFYAYGPAKKKKLFYPRYAVDGYNLEGALKEAERWRSEGSSIRVLGNGEEEETISRSSSSNIGNVFDSTWFRSLIPVPFYHTSILVPVGFREILTSFYGRNWRVMEKRRAWESTTTDLRCKFDALPVCG